MSGLTAHYLSFNRHIKDCLALLGIEKRQVEDALDLGRYLEANAREKAESGPRERAEAENSRVNASLPGDLKE